jgi:hypothetical protein
MQAQEQEEEVVIMEPEPSNKKLIKKFSSGSINLEADLEA